MKRGLSNIFSFILILTLFLSIMGAYWYLEIKRDVYNMSVENAIKKQVEKNRENLLVSYNPENATLIVKNIWGEASKINGILILNNEGLKERIPLNLTLKPGDLLNIKLANIKDNDEIIVYTSLGNIFKVNSWIKNYGSTLSTESTNINNLNFNSEADPDVYKIGNNIAIIELTDIDQYIVFNSTCGEIISINTYSSGDHNVIITPDNYGRIRVAIISGKIIPLNSTFSNVLYIGYNYIIISYINKGLLLRSDGNIIKFESIFDEPLKAFWVKDELIIYNIGNITTESGISVQATHVFRFSDGQLKWNKIIVIPEGIITKVLLDPNNAVYVVSKIIIPSSVTTQYLSCNVIYKINDDEKYNCEISGYPSITPDKLWGEVQPEERQNWQLYNAYFGDENNPLTISSDGYAIYNITELQTIKHVLLHTRISISYDYSSEPSVDTHYVDVIFAAVSPTEYYAVRIKHESPSYLKATIIKNKNGAITHLSSTEIVADYYEKPNLDVVALVDYTNTKVIFRVTIASEDYISYPLASLHGEDTDNIIAGNLLGYRTDTYTISVSVRRIGIIYSVSTFAVHYGPGYRDSCLAVDYIINSTIYSIASNQEFSLSIDSVLYFIPKKITTYSISYDYLNIKNWIQNGIYDSSHVIVRLDYIGVYSLCENSVKLLKRLSGTINNIVYNTEMLWLSDNLVVWALINSPQGIRFSKVDQQ